MPHFRIRKMCLDVLFRCAPQYWKILRRLHEWFVWNTGQMKCMKSNLTQHLVSKIPLYLQKACATRLCFWMTSKYIHAPVSQAYSIWISLLKLENMVGCIGALGPITIHLSIVPCYWSVIFDGPDRPVVHCCKASCLLALSIHGLHINMNPLIYIVFYKPLVSSFSVN
jgi:hypothetical protein